MAEEQVLGFKSARRLKDIDNEHCERMQEREHRPRSCNDSTRRCDSQAGWNFRKAQVIAASYVQYYVSAIWPFWRALSDASRDPSLHFPPCGICDEYRPCPHASVATSSPSHPSCQQ